MDYTAENVEKAVLQFYQAVPGNQAEINTWLTLAQMSKQAWDFSWELLKPDKRPEVQFFGANSLHKKIGRCWNELPTDKIDSLRNQLLQLLVNFSSGPRMVLTRLCVALSSFILQTTPEIWPNAVAELVSTFSQPATLNLQPHQADGVLFEILTVLPEEFITSHILPHRKGPVRNELQKSLNIVVPLLERFFQLSNEILTQALRCFGSWTQFGLPLPESESLVQQAFQAVRSSDHRELAVEGLVHFFSHGDNSRYPQSMQRILVQVVGLEDIFEEAISERDMETCRCLCKLIVLAADHNTDILLQCSLGDGNQVQLASKIISMIVRCTGMPGYFPVEECCSDFPFGFWYNFQDSISEAEGATRMKLFEIYIPLFSHLIDILIVKVQYPPDQEYQSWDAEEKESHRCYRQDIADALTYIYNLLRQPLLIKLCHSLDAIINRSQVQDVRWQEIEAVLFALTSLAETIGPENIRDLAPIFILLPRVPAANHMLVSQALYFIGAFSEYIYDHPQLLVSILPILLQGLHDENLVLAATLSLKDVLQENQLHLQPFAADLLNAFKGVLSSGVLKGNDESRLFWCMGYVLSVLPFDDIMGYVNSVLAPSVETIRNCASSENITTAMRATIVQRLSMISYLFLSLNVDLTRDTSGCENDSGKVEPEGDIHQLQHSLSSGEGSENIAPAAAQGGEKEKKPQPVLFITRDLFPVIEFLLQKLYNDPTVVAAVCDLYKHAVRTLMDDFSSLVPDVSRIILQTFQSAMNPSLLDLAKQILVLFVNDSALSSLCQTLFTGLCNHTLICLESGSIKDLTDIMEGLMSFLSQLTKKSIGLLRHPSTNLAGLYRCGVFGLMMPEYPTCKASCQFLTVFLNLGQDLVPIQQLLNTHGLALMVSLMKAVSGEVPRLNIEPMADVLLALNKNHFPLLCKLMNEVVAQDGFPNPRITKEEKEQFARRILAERTNKRKLKEVVHEYTLLWRGLLNTEYALQTSGPSL